MKTNIIKITAIITAILLMGAISSCKWFKKDPPPYKYLYIPDSLKFPQNTGDSAIFRCIMQDTVIYDTFYIEKTTSMEPYVEQLEDGYHQTGEYEEETILYKNNHFEIKIKHEYYAYPEDMLYIKLLLILDMKSSNKCGCTTSGTSVQNYTITNNFSINNTYYKDVVYTKQCGYCFYDIYRNIQNGLLSYTTNDSLTYNLYKYISINNTAR